MKRAVQLSTIVCLLAFFALSTGLSRELVVRQAPNNSQIALQDLADKIFELVAPAPIVPKVRIPGNGGFSGTSKLEATKCGCGFTAELILSRCVSRAVYHSFNIIPSVNERTLAFPFHVFW